MKKIKAVVALLFVVVTAIFGSQAIASEGHDHGETSSQDTGVILPRFTSMSTSFELVGVANKKQVTLYLDRFADNTPVKGAQVVVDISGVKLDASEHADGEYEVTLPEALKSGATPVVVRISIGNETDELSGEFEWQDAGSSETQAASSSPWTVPVIVKVLLAIIALTLLGFGAWRYRARKTNTQSHQSGEEA